MIKTSWYMYTKVRFSAACARDGKMKGHVDEYNYMRNTDMAY